LAPIDAGIRLPALGQGGSMMSQATTERDGPPRRAPRTAGSDTAGGDPRGGLRDDRRLSTARDCGRRTPDAGPVRRRVPIAVRAQAARCGRQDWTARGPVVD